MKIFHFGFNQTMVNAYVMWVKDIEALGLSASTHLAFKISVGRHLAEDAINARQKLRCPLGPAPRRRHPVHTLYQSDLKWQCVVCDCLQKWLCRPCGNKWMCLEECYWAKHERL
ncbi:hypothetical protein KC19_VG261000 [Ceratodon purpureus]|uniref:Uncharacterized protein n=1 Tax=Ceratodon purpureus TaxID=3225 RepID=A0A8T0HV58_CERPU|nr:hypothetical protein KC19_VG261000 [Ceratodon purpureus]